MNNKETETVLTIRPSEKTLSSVVHQDYIGKKLREELISANVLIIPNEGYVLNVRLFFEPFFKF